MIYLAGNNVNAMVLQTNVAVPLFISKIVIVQSLLLVNQNIKNPSCGVTVIPFVQQKFIFENS